MPIEVAWCNAWIFGYTLLQQAQTFAHDFAGIPVTAGLNQVLDNLFLVWSEDNVASGLDDLRVRTSQWRLVSGLLCHYDADVNFPPVTVGPFRFESAKKQVHYQVFLHQLDELKSI